MKSEALVTSSCLRNKLKKIASKDRIIIVASILLLTLLVLLRVGYHIVIQSKRLSEITPLWLVLIGAVIGFCSITLLIHKKNLLIKDYIMGVTGGVFSFYIISIGYRRFPSVFLITLFATIFINMTLIKIRMKKINKLKKKEK